MAVVRLAGELGFLTGVKRFAVARFGTLSIDGTKVRANASKRKAMSYGRMVEEEKRLEAEIKALVGRAGAVDEEEDERYGVDVRGDELAVEGENQLIVAAQVTANASDQGQMLPRLDEVKADCGKGPETLLADAGYCNEADLASLEERGVDAYVALGREGNKAVAVNAKAHPARARMAKVQGEWALVCLALNMKRMQGLATA